MVDACKLLGVDIMTGHWEFTWATSACWKSSKRTSRARSTSSPRTSRPRDFGDKVFEPFAMREMNGVKVAVIGQAFPYTPIANPRWMVPDWTFGIQDDNMQKTVDEARAKGAQVVVLLSHNGMDVDLKMASRVTGIDAILGGHTHDGVPKPVIIKNAGGQTLVTNAGSNGKFLGVLDFDVKNGKVSDFRYKLLPVFSNLLPADAEMAALIDKVRAPHKAKLEEKLAVSEGLLYRRGNFNGSWDQLILDAIMEVQGADIGFSPGFRWGTTILPGQAITFEHLMDQTAITYPNATLDRDERRTDQDHPRRRRRQPVQSRSLLPAGRRHGARRRPAIHLRPQREDRQPHPGHAPGRQTARRRAEVQGRRLGAGGRRREGRAGMGRRGALSARQEDRHPAQAEPAQAAGHESSIGTARQRPAARSPHARVG
jgi:thiosulfohydrolase SoxB